MSVDCKIKLPLYVEPKKILDVILRITGKEPHFTKLYNEKPNIDIKEPSSHKNSYYLTLNEENNHIKINDDESGFIIFHSATGKKYSWFLHFIDEDQDYKTILPGLYSFSIIVAKRLVDFFGGKALFNDSMDWDDADYVYENNNPKFAKKSKEDPPNFKYYQYINLLKEEPLITRAEMEWANTFERIDDDIENLVEILEKKQLYNELNYDLNSHNKAKKTLKV